MFKKFKSEAFVAIAAIVISVCALFVSFYEARIMRTQQKASVWPYVQISQEYNHERFALNALNRGVGPAMIESVILTLDGKPQENLHTLLNNVLGKGHGLGYSNTKVSGINNQVLSKDYDKFMISMNWDEAGKVREFTENFNRIGYEVVYSSILGDCWVLTNENDPEPCDCPGDKKLKTQFQF